MDVDKQPTTQTNVEGKETNLPFQEVFPDAGEDETVEMISSTVNGENAIICRLDAFNICYRLDKLGIMHPLGNIRLVPYYY